MGGIPPHRFFCGASVVQRLMAMSCLRITWTQDAVLSTSLLAWHEGFLQNAGTGEIKSPSTIASPIPGAQADGEIKPGTREIKSPSAIATPIPDEQTHGEIKPRHWRDQVSKHHRYTPSTAHRHMERSKRSREETREIKPVYFVNY